MELLNPNALSIVTLVRNSFLMEPANPNAPSNVTTEHNPLEKNSIQAYTCNRIIGDELNILRMAVAPESRRFGFAGRLLDLVLSLSGQKGATQAYLEVRPSNVPAICSVHQKRFSGNRHTSRLLS